MRCPHCGSELPEGGTPGPGPALETPTQPFLVGGPALPAPRPASAEALLAGRFRILGEIGRGGMGVVFRALDLKLEQEVALKFLPETVDQDPELQERLRAEVGTARQVAHPNVCRVFDLGEADGRSFLTMEFIDGEDLGTRLGRGPLAHPQALSLARQLCAGLAAIHARRIVHKDLKPANVMVDPQGVARITDFGLAELLQSTEARRAREGTPLFMAPEQLAGGAVTQASDLYALGLLLCACSPGSIRSRPATWRNWGGCAPSRRSRRRAGLRR